MKNSIKITSVILAILIVDQISKIWIKTHFTLGESIQVTSWFYIYFVENSGMAFGMDFIGKLFLSLFRLIAIGFLGYFVYLLHKRGYRTGYILCLSLILAGAIGNAIDGTFYGLIFSESAYYNVAQIFPAGGGYAPLLYGKVVDMLYFPLFTFPEWIPLLGGEVFFSPVFNIADSAVCVGVALALLFYRKDLNESLETKKKKENVQNEN